MKKILVLGGVGAMATETTIDLVQTSDFEEIMVADIDLAKIESFIKDTGDSRLRAAKVDAESIDQMADLITGYDVVANGLPRVYCENAIRAGIKAGVGMLDLISPHEETLALKAMAEVGPGGHHFGTSHTQERYDREFHEPILSSRLPWDQWQAAGSPDARARSSSSAGSRGSSPNW